MRHITRLFKSLVLAAALPLAMVGTAQATLVDVGTQTGTFSGNTRGFWFTAPTDFTITGVGLPTTASNGTFDVAILLLNNNPPLFSGSTNDFSTLLLARGGVGSDLLSTNIVVHTGDIIGVLGSRGGVNSYGASPYATDILGHGVTLARLGMQFDLRNTDPQNLWTEQGGSISRVLLNVEATAAPSNNNVPEPASLSLLALGLLGLGVARKRQAR